MTKITIPTCDCWEYGLEYDDPFNGRITLKVWTREGSGMWMDDWFFCPYCRAKAKEVE